MTHKGCAHCGWEASFLQLNKDGGGYVHCLNVNCRVETPICKSEKEAWAIWDKRFGFSSPGTYRSDAGVKDAEAEVSNG